MKEESYDIKNSARIVGQLYPILVDSEGRIIDGFHRSKADPSWKKIKLDEIKTEKERILVRIIANTHRREVSFDERQKDMVALAKELAKEGVKREDMVNTIANLTGFTPQYVRMLLPSKYKMSERAHEKMTFSYLPVSVKIKPEVLEEIKKRGKVEKVIPQLIEKGLLSSAKVTKEKSPELAPEPIFTGEEWECKCGAVYRLYHITNKEHKFELIKEGDKEFKGD